MAGRAAEPHGRVYLGVGMTKDQYKSTFILACQCVQMSQPPQWKFNAELNLHYYYDQQRDQIVYENGQRVNRPTNNEQQAPTAPRTISMSSGSMTGPYTTSSNSYTYRNAQNLQAQTSVSPTRSHTSNSYMQHPYNAHTSIDLTETPFTPSALAASFKPLSLNDAGPPASQSVKVVRTRQTSQGSVRQDYRTREMVMYDKQPTSPDAEVDTGAQEERRLYSSRRPLILRCAILTNDLQASNAGLIQRSSSQSVE